MKTTLPIVTVGLAFALAACAHDEPAKSAPPFGPASSEASAPLAGRSNDIAFMAGPRAPSTFEAGTLAQTVPADTADAGAHLSDEQILQITRTANEDEIEQAELAHTRSRDERVQKLAASMVRDHSTAKDKGDDLARKDSLTPEPSPQSVKLDRDSEEVMRALKLEEGQNFDRAYLDAQVREHTGLLDMLNTTLIPSSTGADVRTYLHDAKAMVEDHLSHATALQQAIAAK